jgi:micrococcal nuclease
LVLKADILHSCLLFFRAPIKLQSGTRYTCNILNPHLSSRFMKHPILFVFIFTLISQCNAENVTGRVIKISDGDTFTILTKSNKQIRVRLHGIDAPERGQDFSAVSKQFLSDLVFNKVVTIISKNTDRYGRIIGVVKINNTIVNEELLKTGLAWHYTKYDSNSRWAELEANAKMKKKGLWSMANPVAPWKYREGKRKFIRRPNATKSATLSSHLYCPYINRIAVINPA